MNIANLNFNSAVSNLQAGQSVSSESKPSGVGGGQISAMGSALGALTGIQIPQGAMSSISGSDARVLDALPQPGNH